MEQKPLPQPSKGNDPDRYQLRTKGGQPLAFIGCRSRALDEIEQMRLLAPDTDVELFDAYEGKVIA